MDVLIIAAAALSLIAFLLSIRAISLAGSPKTDVNAIETAAYEAPRSAGGETIAAISAAVAAYIGAEERVAAVSAASYIAAETPQAALSGGFTARKLKRPGATAPAWTQASREERIYHRL